MHPTFSGLHAAAPGLSMRDDGRVHPGEHSVAEITSSLIPSWLDQVAERLGRRAVATSFLGTWLAGPVTTMVTAALVARGRSPLLSADTVWLRRAAGGWVDAIVVPPGAAVLAGDRDADDAAAVVLPSRAALIDHAAGALVSVVGPLLDVVAAHGSFGARGLWGNAVADRVLDCTTALVRAGAAPADRAFGTSGALLRAIDAIAPVTLPTPGISVVAHHGVPMPFTVKSCCCLMYRLDTADATDGGPPPESFCTACPLIDDAGRAPRWRTYLDSARPARGQSPLRGV